MSRSTKSLISGVAAIAAIASIAPMAVADYSSVNALVGADSAQGPSYSSPNAILGDRAPTTSAPTAKSGFSSVSALTGGGETVRSPLAEAPSSSSSGFDWEDALIGAALGLMLAASIGAGFVALRRRERTRVQPSI